MHPTRRQLLAAGAAALAPVPAAALPTATPADLGIDPRRLQHAYDRLDEWTRGANAPVPGGAILVGRHGKALAPRFFGRQGPEPDAGPIRADGLFLMASITKPVVYMAAMILVERGKLNLTDAVTRYVPEFVAHGKGAVLVSHLFTHTSGLPDMPPGNAELRRKHSDLKAFYAAAAKETTLQFPPGTNVSYQSCGTIVVADIVERLSGLPVAEFVKREIFDPLGMASTRLGLGGLDRERVVRVQIQDYMVGTDFGWNSRYWQDLGAPWGGMFSTPADFATVLHLLLNGGAVGGVRILSPASVRMMTTNRLDDYADLPEPLRRTQPWGLGWRLNHPGTPGSWSDLLGRDVFGHTGATGTLAWADPRTGGFAVLLTNALREKQPWRLVHLSNAVAAAFV